MFFTSVQYHFDSAHLLRNYKGKCASLHGHRFNVSATFAFSELDELGISTDFGILKSNLKSIADSLDHCFLNEKPPFDKLNPTAENLSMYFFQELKKTLTKGKITKVTIYESPTAWVEYTE
ncbi:MAG: 6-carboxytetrahydropterin synthase [Candidatus Riflebacteria bacterium]|nr:6-carboxytetrahydropterin synthase [Candidatus Riflebacteria bacterium]